MRLSRVKKRLICLAVVAALALPFAIHWYVGFEARHFGSEAADEAVTRANRANFAESEWNKLKDLARNEDFRALIAEEFDNQCIDANWIFQLIIDNQYGDTDPQLAAILAELVPEPATQEECAAANEQPQDAQSDDSNTSTTVADNG